MGNIKQLKAFNSAIRQQESYQQYLRYENAKKQAAKEEEERKRRKAAEEAKGAVVKASRQEIKNEKPENSVPDTLARQEQDTVQQIGNNWSTQNNKKQSKPQKKQERLSPWGVGNKEGLNYLTGEDPSRPFTKDGKIKPYNFANNDWTRTHQKQKDDFLKVMDKAWDASVESYKHFISTPARVRDLQTTRDEVADEMDKAVENEQYDDVKIYKEHLDRLDKEIETEVNWYNKTDPNNLNFRNAEGLEAPDGYYKSSIAKGLEYAFKGIAPALSTVFGVTSDYEEQKAEKQKKPTFLNDVYHTWMISKNQTQIDSSRGKIQTAEQISRMFNRNALDHYKKLVDRQGELKQQEKKIRYDYLHGNGFPSNKLQEILDPIQDESLKLYDQIKAYDDMFTTMAGYENQTFLGDWVSSSQSGLNKLNLDFGTGLGTSLNGFTDNINGYRKAVKNGNQAAADVYRKRLYGIIDSFDKRKNQMVKLWKHDIDIDTADLEKYTKDGYQISDYYKYNEEAANNLAWYNPKKLWMAPSLLGASLSSPEKAAIAGATSLAAAFSGGTIVPIIAGITNFAMGMSMGADENFANVAQATQLMATNDLKERGLDDALLKNARDLFGNDITLEDAVNKFYEGKFIPNNFKIRQTLIDATAGATRQYYEGMGVNTFDSLTDAIISCTPMGMFSRESRVGMNMLDKAAAYADKKALRRQIKKALKNSKSKFLTSEERQGIREWADNSTSLRDLVRKPGEFADDVRSLTKDIADDMGLVTLRQAIGNKIAKVENKYIGAIAKRSLKHADRVVDMASEMPARILKYRHNWDITKRAIGDIGKRAIAGMYSEGMEEGLQQVQQYERMHNRDDAYFNVAEQLPLTVLDGAKLWANFLIKDPENATAEEKDIWENMHGGILGFLLQGLGGAAVQTGTGTYRQYKLSNLIANNLLCDKLSNDDYLRKAQIFSHEISRGNFAGIMQTINEYQNHANELNSDNSTYRVDLGDYTKDLRDMVTRVAALRNDEKVKSIAKSAGFLIDEKNDTKMQEIKSALRSMKHAEEYKQKAKDYDSYIAILAGRLNDTRESKDFYESKLKDMISASSNIDMSFDDYLQQNASDKDISALKPFLDDKNDFILKEDDQNYEHFKQLYDTTLRNYQTRNENSRTLNELVAQLLTTQFFKDMETIKSRRGGSTISSRAKFNFDQTANRIKDIFGKDIKLDTVDDIKKFAADHGYTIDDDYVDLIRQSEEAQMQYAFNSEVANKLMTDAKFAKRSVELYKKAVKSDEELRQNVEDDFYNNELDRQKRQTAQITDDDNSFVKDGKTYTVRGSEKEGYQLYEYDKENDRLIPTTKRFDKNEWYDERQKYDQRTKDISSLRSKYQDYNKLINKNEADLTDAEKARLKIYKEKYSNKFASAQQELDAYDNDLDSMSKTPGLQTDTTESEDNIQQYALNRDFSQDQYNQAMQELAPISSDNIHTIEQNIRKAIENGDKPKHITKKGQKVKYTLGDQELTKAQYQYAKYLINKKKKESKRVQKDENLKSLSDIVSEKQREHQFDGKLDLGIGEESQEQQQEESGGIAGLLENKKQLPAVIEKPKMVPFDQILDEDQQEYPAGINPVYTDVENLRKKLPTPEQPSQPVPTVETRKYKGRDITEDQYNAIHELLKFSAANPHNHREWRTGENYFIDVDGKLTMHRRLHSILKENIEPEEDEVSLTKYFATKIQEKRDAWLNAIDQNKSKEEIETAKRKYIDFITALRDEKYNIAKSLYGEGKYADDCYVNLEGYLKSDEFLKSDDTVTALAKMLKHDQTKLFQTWGSTQTGNYFDEIARNIFAGVNLQYDPKYQMTEEVFNKIVEDLKKQKAFLDKMGYVTITDPLFWHCELFDKNKQSQGFVAGETDMVAVDKDGHIVIIDFKSSKHSWVGDKNGYIEALDLRYKGGKWQARQKATTRDRYTDQLNSYAKMIESCTGLQASKLYVLGAQFDSKLKSVADNKNTVLLSVESAQPSVFVEIVRIDPSYDYKSYTEDRKAIKANLTLLQQINYNTELLFQQLKSKFDQLIFDYPDVEDQALKDKLKHFSNIISGFKDTMSRSTTLDLAQKLNEYTASKIQQLNQLEHDLSIYTTQHSEGPTKEKFNPNERFRDREEAKKHNSIAVNKSVTNPIVLKEIELFKKWTCDPDFLNTVRFEIDFKKSGFIKNVATCGNRLYFSQISYKGQKISEGTLGALYMLFNVDQKLRNKLIDLYMANHEDIDSGKAKVILSDLTRTNGIFQFDGQERGVKQAINLTDKQLNNLTTQNNDAQLLITDKYNNYVFMDPDVSKQPFGDGTSIKDIKVAPSQLKGRVTPGMIYIWVNQHFVEDEQSGANPHFILVPLTPQRLSSSSVDLVLNILQQPKSTLAQATDENGKTIQGPVTNSKLLHYLIRFGSSSVEMGNTFQFNYEQDASGKYNYNRVFISTDGGQTRTTFDLTNAVDVQKLKDVLNKNMYLYTQNAYLLRDRLGKPWAKGMFSDIKQWFENNPNVNSIKYSDDLIITRDDVNQNMSGIAWMIKNNWVKTPYVGTSDAIVSFNDAKLEYGDAKPDQKIKQDAPDTDPILPPVSPIFEQPSQPSQTNDGVGEDFDPSSLFVDDDSVFGAMAHRRNKGTVSKEDAIKVVQRICGPSIEPKFIDGIINKSKYGDVVGLCTADGIKIATTAENGVEYHESFHRVVELLMPDDQREKLYNWYRKKYGKNKELKDRDIAEGLADMFYDYGRNAWHPSNFILKFFSRLYNYVNALINTKSLRTALMYTRIDYGKYKNNKVSEEHVKRFKEIFRNGLAMTVTDRKGEEHTFNHIYSRTQLNDAADVIVRRMITAYGVDMLGQNANEIKTEIENFSKSDNKFYPYYIQYIAKGMSEEDMDKKVENGQWRPIDRNNILVMREVFKNWSAVQPLIESRLESFGLRKRKDRLQDTKDGNDSDPQLKKNAVSEDIDSHSDEFYSHSLSDDVSAPIQWMLSNISAERYATTEDVSAGLVKSVYKTNKDGKVILDKNGNPIRETVSTSKNSFGMKTLLPFKEVHQRLLIELHDVKDVADLQERLFKLGQNDYVFNKIANLLFRIRYQSYTRFTNEEKFGDYVGAPVVHYDGGVLNPSYYIADPKNMTNQDIYPQQITLVKDLYKNGKLVAKKGDILNGAIIMQNQDLQSITTLFFQAVKAQKLNFNFLNVRNATDSNMNKIDGKYSYNFAPTNTDQSEAIYPLQWFDLVRSGFTGLYLKNGEINKNFTAFNDARIKLLQIQNGLIKGFTLNLNDKTYNVTKFEDLDQIATMVVNSLNDVGIMISKPVLYNILHRLDPSKTSYHDAFRIFMVGNTRSKTTINTLIANGGVLDVLDQAVKSGNKEMFQKDFVKGKGANAQKSGAFQYKRNQFITWLASETGVYKAMNKEVMTIGADNTKMYMYAQNNTVSDVTEDLNNALNDDGTVNTNSILNDLKDVQYVLFKDDNGQTHGSIMAKQLMDPAFNRNHKKITITTDAGVKNRVASNQSIKFSEQGIREDYLTRIEALSDGYIIMPTLSDKSTYMMIKGFQVPGIFDSNGNIVGKPILFNGVGKCFIKWSDADTLTTSVGTEVIDQFMEYFEAEHRNVLKTLSDLGYGPNGKAVAIDKTQMIKNYHLGTKNGARYFSLAGIYDENDNFISFNFQTFTTDKTGKKVLTEDTGVIESNKIAEREYFNKPIEEKRRIVSRILQHRLNDELANMVKHGLIKEQENDVTSAEDKAYRNYANVLLDNDKIERLKRAYINLQDKSIASDPRYAESMAVVAYTFDVMCKQLMSMEEARRFYTGMPQFFKAKFDKSGNLVEFGADETKRYGGLGSTGSNNRADIPGIDPTYKCAEVKDWEPKSASYESFKESFRSDEYRDAYNNIKLSENPNMTSIEKEELYRATDNMKLDAIAEELKNKGVLDLINAKIEKEADSYSSINVADGSAFITDKMAENLLKMRGAYTENVKKAFETLRGESKYYMSNSKAYAIVHNALISTQKYSAFGYRMQNGIPVHYYHKYALFAVFKNISYGFMKHVYDKMNDPENGVDMLLFDSAVKSGSQAAQTFNPEMSAKDISNFSFKDHIYEVKYSNVRRQLNTDPRTDEIMDAGTQAMKVALSVLRDGQSYDIKLQDGKTTSMTANQIRDRIMNKMNRLSEMGYTELTKQFLDSNGLVNMENLQKFLIGELSSRNADRNIMDAISTLNDSDSDFGVDINSVSNMGWIESILTSKVNDAAIAIKFKGNAFYQRSVFGMDSPYTVLNDKDTNDLKLGNGKPLQMVNEEGSMDAVVSIDYFMDIIPKNIRYNFTKAKQWLIDNGVISGVKTGDTEWSNAEAQTMSYRIPTQAMASINALRFVDVLPTVRDTIVLPKEFTKSTGSDFDIDKLYMSSLFYDIDEEIIGKGKTKEGKEYDIKKHSATTYNLKDEKRNTTNELLRTYISLIKTGGKQVENGKIEGSRYSHITRRSIDNDTELVTNVLDELEGNKTKDTYEPYKFESLGNQVNVRSSFAVGKTGIGPYALNNNNQILTQLYNVSFIDDGGILSNLGATSLHRYVDFDNNSILSWISALINAHVDVAKDPYILRLNINKATYNLSALLLRLGFGKHAFYFLNNPVMKELAQIYNECDGLIVDDPGKSPTARKQDAEKEYINTNLDYTKAAEYLNARPSERRKIYNDVAEDIKKIFGLNEDAPKVNGQTILQYCAKQFYGKDVSDKSLSGYIGDTKMTGKDVQSLIYIAFKEFEPYAQALSNLVQYTKIDTKKQGINFDDQQTYLERYYNLKNSGVFDDNLQRLLEDSYIERKTMYGTSFVKTILGDKMIHMTDSYIGARDEILERLNNRTNATKQAVNRAMMQYIKQKCFNNAFQTYIDKFNKEHNTEYTPYSYWKTLITDNSQRSILKRFIIFQRLVRNDKTGKLKEFGQFGDITNSILQRLHQLSYTAPYGQDHYNLVSLQESSEDDSDISNTLIDDWQTMLEYTNDDKKLQTFVRNFANDLAIYAFMSSADNKQRTSFFKYVPLSWRQSFGYCDEIHNAFEEYNNSSFSPLEGSSKYSINYDDFIQNFAYDDNIIPVTKNKIYINSPQGMMVRNNFIESTFTYEDIDNNNKVQRTEARNLIGLSFYKGAYHAVISKNKRGEFPRYIKTRRQGITSSDQDRTLLYKLVDTGSITSGMTSIEYPIYQLVNQKGLQLKIGSMTYQFYSCGIQDDYKRVYFRGGVQPTEDMVQQAYNNRILKIKEYVNSHPGNIRNALVRLGWFRSDDVTNSANNTFAANQAFRDMDTDKPININYNVGDNPALSTSAIRPIKDIFKVSENLTHDTLVYEISPKTKHSAPTVDHAMAAMKILYTDLNLKDKITKINAILNAKTASQANAIANSVELGIAKTAWFKNKANLLEAFTEESFKENPKYLKLLQDTGNREFTALTRKGKILDEIKEYGEGTGRSMYAEILTQVRDKLVSNTEKQPSDKKQKIVQSYEQLLKDLGGDENAKSEIRDVINTAIKGVSFEQLLQTVKPVFTKEEQNQIKKALNGRDLKVMSVSRQTDPAFFAKEIIKMLEKNAQKPFTDPTRINAIEIWSKHDGMPIQSILRACRKYKVAPMMSFSITGLGDTALEKGVLKYTDLLDRIEKLIKEGDLDPRTTTFRIDPILVGVSNIEDIKKIVQRGKSMGIKKFVTSLVQSYGYTDGRSDDRHVVSGISKATSEDGNPYDWGKYYGYITEEDFKKSSYFQQKYIAAHPKAGYKEITSAGAKAGVRIVTRSSIGKIHFIPKNEYIQQIGKELLDLNQDPDIEIETCSFFINGLKASACLDPMIIERITGIDVTKEDGSYDKDTSRPDCMCYGAHSDMFRVNEKQCFSSCSYCYAGKSINNALSYYDNNGNLKENALTKVLFEENPQPNSSKFDNKKAVFYSGGAEGSDSYWGLLAKHFDIKMKNYTVSDWDNLSQQWKQKLDQEYKSVVKILGRHELDINTYSGKLVRRDMMQADKADAIFAIGSVDNRGFVSGGTAYAATRGIQRGIPVYLFDQNDGVWKVWNKTQFIKTTMPTLTTNAALIGTRELKPSGKNEIVKIFVNTFKQDLHNTELFSMFDDSTFDVILNEMLKSDDLYKEYDKSLKDYPANESLDNLADKIDEQCK